MKHRILTALLVLLAAVTTQSACAQDVWNSLYKDIERQIVPPTFPDQSFPITKYGAKPKNSAAKNQKAINKAIATCSRKGGGSVIVPAGEWSTGAITLLSNVNLVLEEGAVLHFAFEPDLYPNVLTRWEGLDCWNYQPCIYAYGQTNIAITGRGTIDGGATEDNWWLMSGKKHDGKVLKGSECQSNPDGRPLLLKQAEDGVDMNERIFGKGKGLRPQLVNLYKCENILIEGVTMLRSPFWVMHPLLSKNLTVRDVKVWNEGPNGDGCDPESCENVLIEGCTFHTGDDCIAIKSGRNADGRLWGIPSKNFIVRKCSFEDGHGGVVIGSEISGGYQNLFVEDCIMDSPSLDRVLRIKTNPCRGGVIENVYFRNVKVGQCKESVLKINLDYEPKEICCRDYPPTVRNVFMENVTCEKSKYGVMVVGLKDLCNVYNINLTNCTFNGVKDEPVYRSGLTRDFHFNNLVINGKVVLAELPFKTYSEWLTHSEMRRVPQAFMLDFAKKPRWSYVMGIEMEGMLDTYLAHKDDPRNAAIIDYLHGYARKMIADDGSIRSYKMADYNLDQIRTGKYILRMEQLFPEAKNRMACDTLWTQLQQQPRTKQGVWFHKANYANQVWLDGIFMGLPFYTNYARLYLDTPTATKAQRKRAQKIYDDVVMQISKTDQFTYDASTSLWKHAWDESHSIFWADPATGLSQHTWGRALGWYAMAIIEVLDALPQDYAKRPDIIALLNKVLASVVKYQDKKSGLWYDVLDVNDPRNYLEATCSSMFAYCLLKAARLGYVTDEYRQAGIRAFEGITREFIRVNPDATISLTRCCEVSGLGPESKPHRDGSFDYYISEPVRDNDAKGVGPFLWAALEMEALNHPAAFLTKSTKQIQLDEWGN